MAEPDNDSGPGAPTNKEPDRFLPSANVSRIMKKALPLKAKISKDAKDVVQECVSEFISFITGEASDKCQIEKRKTLSSDDLIWAMTKLGFEDYLEPLKLYMAKYRKMEAQREKPARGGGNEEGGSSSGGGIYGDSLMEYYDEGQIMYAGGDFGGFQHIGSDSFGNPEQTGGGSFSNPQQIGGSFGNPEQIGGGSLGNPQQIGGSFGNPKQIGGGSFGNPEQIGSFGNPEHIGGTGSFGEGGMGKPGGSGSYGGGRASTGTPWPR